MGLNMKEKGGNEEIQTPLSKGIEKRKKTLLDELTTLTGYHRKSAVRLLNLKPVKVKPEKSRKN